MFGKTQRDCHDATMCIAAVMVDYKYMRCEDLLCRSEEEQNEIVEVFNCDQVHKRMSPPLARRKANYHDAMVVKDGQALC